MQPSNVFLQQPKTLAKAWSSIAPRYQMNPLSTLRAQLLNQRRPSLVARKKLRLWLRNSGSLINQLQFCLSRSTMLADWLRTKKRKWALVHKKKKKKERNSLSSNRISDSITVSLTCVSQQTRQSLNSNPESADFIENSCSKTGSLRSIPQK